MVALLLPAVQGAREAGRRTECLNNLKQMGIGVHVYHDAFALLPHGGAGVASLTIPASKARWELSWGACILPGLEQQALYDAINPHEPYLHASNLEPGRTLVKTFICPSAPKKDLYKPNGDTPTNATKYARTDYGGNWGERALRCFPATNCQNNYSDAGDTSGWGRGVMLLGNEPRLPLAQILDGTSHTIMLGEAPEGLHSLWIGHKNVFDQSAPINAKTLYGSPWASCQIAKTAKGGAFCDFAQEFHSYHIRGAQFVFVDGSARFVAENVDLKTFAAQLSRSGAEAIAAN